MPRRDRIAIGKAIVDRPRRDDHWVTTDTAPLSFAAATKEVPANSKYFKVCTEPYFEVHILRVGRSWRRLWHFSCVVLLVRSFACGMAFYRLSSLGYSEALLY